MYDSWVFIARIYIAPDSVLRFNYFYLIYVREVTTFHLQTKTLQCCEKSSRIGERNVKDKKTEERRLVQ